MKQIDEALKTQIKEAIENAERESSCEFVTVITQKSGNYRIYAFFVAALSALLIPHLILWLTNWLSVAEVLRQQIVGFIFLMILTQLSFVINLLVPTAIMQRQAALVAAESFRKFGLYKTKKRRAVLFFVSVDERFATIIADTGIEEKIDPSVWESIIETFRMNLNTKGIAQGYLEAIRGCGEILKREFPAEDGDTDELPNNLIVDAE